MLTWFVNFSPYVVGTSRAHYGLPIPPSSLYLTPPICLSCHCDENCVTISPLESALTNCDAHKSFRMRSYKNCRVSPAVSCSSSRRALKSQPPHAVSFLFVFNRLRTLSFYVCPKSFICHPYENCRRWGILLILELVFLPVQSEGSSEAAGCGVGSAVSAPGRVTYTASSKLESNSNPAR
jgi:hypothetical protein